MKNNIIHYVEFKAHDLKAIKSFYSKSFGWGFVDYGPTYIGINDAGLDGGFEKTDDEIVNGALVILYHNDLELIKAKIIANGGKISVDIFSFPGGQRFHFLDPSGNELAVWKQD